MGRYQTYGARYPVRMSLRINKFLANTRIDMSVDQDNLRRKNEELIQAFREKSRKLLQTQELYDKRKRQDMLGQVQNAASDAVDHTIQASATANRFADAVGNQNQSQHSVQPSPFSSMQNNGIQYSGAALSGVGSSMAPPTGRTGNGDGTWAGFSSQKSVQGL